jgi:predicted NAD/FAD-binding protein
VAALAALLVSLAQRVLSTPVRAMRRRAGTVTGAIEYADGTSEEITRASIAATPERALRLLSFALPLLGAALVVARI